MSEFYQEDNRFFIKSFILDNTANLNRWGVTRDALVNNLESFIGKPLVLTADFGHPEASSGDTLFAEQEKFKVGKIIKVGIDHESGKAWAVSEITNKEAQILVKDGGVNFVSPSIVFRNSDLRYTDGVEVVTVFEGAHLALVKDPAYTIQKAQIKGKCAGSESTCLTQLEKVQASVEKPPIINSLNAKCDKKGNMDNLEEEKKELEESKKATSKKAMTEEEEKLHANEVEDEEKKESKKAIREVLAELKAIKDELKAEKDVFVSEIVSAKLAKGYIREAEKQGEIKKLEAESITTLKQLAAEYKEQPKAKPYHVLEYGKASVESSPDSLLVLLGGRN